MGKIKIFFKKIFGSSVELDKYLLEGDIPKVAKKVEGNLIPRQTNFRVLFDTPRFFDAEEVKRNANKLADEVSRLVGREVVYKEGAEYGGVIRLYYTLALTDLKKEVVK